MFEDEVVHEDEALLEELEEEHVIEDEGYQLKLDCTICKKSLIVKMEESYKQQIASLELKLIQQQNRIDKYYYVNELTDDEENVFEGKGKGYVKQACNLTLKNNTQARLNVRRGAIDFYNWTIRHNL